MPSDVARASEEAAAAEGVSGPPSAKLVVRLFLIPLLIVAGAVGVMLLISMLVGGTPSMEEALKRLKNSGGARTAAVLVGPGSKQRYMDAKALVDQMKAGMKEPERVRLTDDLGDILANHTKPEEGEIRHFLLLALGRAWQRDPAAAEMNSPAAVASRRQAMEVLNRYADDPELATRKAAVLAMAYLAGTDQAEQALPKLAQKLGDADEDVDVRIAAATALGPLATADQKAVIEALHAAMGEDDPRKAELVWSSALSLAQLNQKDVADTILKLLSRDELSKMQYYDRETDPKNGAFRTLSDQEQQRILINTMIGARNLDVKEVKDRLAELAKSDPSPRVRAAGKELLAGSGSQQ